MLIEYEINPTLVLLSTISHHKLRLLTIFWNQFSGNVKESKKPDKSLKKNQYEKLSEKEFYIVHIDSIISSILINTDLLLNAILLISYITAKINSHTEVKVK